jgi:uncharacterized protein (DUF1697 family)
MTKRPVSPRSRSKPDDLHIALLRGINVGGRNRLPMAGLTAMFIDVGCADVRTYIQSGNVVFRAAPRTANRIPGLIAKSLSDGVGLKIPVVVRGAADFHRVAAENPFVGTGADLALIHVGFLADAPGAARSAALDRERSPGDSFELRGREIYLSTPNGVAQTRYTNAYFDSALATISTFRNWRTVLKLAEMLKEMA